MVVRRSVDGRHRAGASLAELRRRRPLGAARLAPHRFPADPPDYQVVGSCHGGPDRPRHGRDGGGMIARPECAVTWPLGPPRKSMLESVVWSIDRNVVTTIAVRLAIVAGGFIASIVTARFLSPSGRGEYFL